DINLKLLSVNFNLNSVDVDELYQDFSDKCGRVLDELAPIHNVMKKNYHVSCFDNELKSKNNERDRAFGLFKNSRDEESWMCYKVLRKECTALNTLKKKKYFYCKVDMNKKNPWKTLKSLIKGNDRHNVYGRGIVFDVQGTDF
ncbi:hypothetical protein HHI36_022286, partial [Cryptolaemus montrouzieri]